MMLTDLLFIAGVGIAIAVYFRYRARDVEARMASEMSMTDQLTGLRNRRYLAQTMDADASLALRRLPRSPRMISGQPRGDDLTFFMVDLDHFKVVNDLWGHFVGDAVLAEVAQVLRRVCRDSDVVVRWGGEEFVVVARFADRRDAVLTAERLRAAVAEHAIELPGVPPIHMTCSIGYASFPFDLRDPEVMSWNDLLALSDFAMYRSKRDGRDRVTGFIAGAAALPARPATWQAADVERCLATGSIRLDDSLATIQQRLADAERVRELHLA